MLRVLTIIGTGLAVLAITVVVLNAAYQQVAPKKWEIDQAVAQNNIELFRQLIARSQQAENIKKAFYVVAALEIFITLGLLIAEARQRPKTTAELEGPPLQAKKTTPVDVSQEDKKYMKQCRSCQAWIPKAAETCHRCNAKQTK